MSEFMLQQTQVVRVVPAYTRFLARFPSLRSLARASLADVLREWSGLGYNRRARDLHRIARALKGRLPHDVAGLDALPGVGAYTAAAVACFAYGETIAFAETNIRRVLGRALIGRIATEREARELDERLMSRRAPARWHHALMDIGATVCVARQPRCEACPLARGCAFRASGMRAEPPARRPGPFASSDRKVRGRIVALLTTSAAGMTVAALRRAVGDPRVARLISALADEGLVTRAWRRVLLPY